MKNLIQAAAVTLFAASTAQAQQAVQWRVQEGGNGHWYQLITRAGRSWTELQDAASLRAGYLATMTSVGERVFLVGNVLGGNNCFIGGYQLSTGSEPSGDWRWVSGEPFEWTGWATGEPNNFPQVGDEDAMGCYGSGEWVDITHVSTSWRCNHAVVEWSADCNNDGIVDYGQCRDGSLPDYNGNNVPDCCEAGSPCVAGNYPREWRTAEGGSGHWYQLSIQQLGVTWPVANLMSRGGGGRLAQIENAMERQHLFDLCASSAEAWNLDGGGALGPWLGGLQQTGASEPNGGWIWTDGTPVDFAACGFVTSDPSGCGANEDRMSFWCPDSTSVYVGSSAYETSDFPAGGTCGTLGPVRAFITEWSADCNNDGIVDKGQVLQGQLQDSNGDGIPDVCQQATCVDADFFRDFNVNGADLGILLSQWGPSTPLTVSDLNRDGVVNGVDLGMFLAFWGPCP